MTESQSKRIYWPLWSAAWKANWKKEGNAVVPSRDWAAGTPGDLVWGAAFRAARREARGVAADDLRYACHRVALGRDKSSKDLTNAELDLVSALLRVLADPDDLDAALDHQDPSRAVRRRLEWGVSSSGFPAAYVAAVCRSKFGVYDWSTLDNTRLSQLVITLSQRARAKSQAKPQPKAAPAAQCSPSAEDGPKTPF